MGSSAGKLKKNTSRSAVVSVNIKQDDDKVQALASETHYSSRMSKCKTKEDRKGEEEENMMSGACNNGHSESSRKTKEMENQLAEFECENLDLQDKLQCVEEEVEFLRKTKADTVMPQFTETIKAKDLYIEQLLQEANTAKEESNKLRIKYKKKLRAISSKLVEEKQGCSLKVFELQGETNRLVEENRKLRDLLAKHSNETPKGESFALEEDGRTKIILELSSKVSDQDARITELLSQVAMKERSIAEMKEDLRMRDKAITSQYDAEQRGDINSMDHNSELGLKLITQEMRDVKKNKKVARKPPPGGDKDTRQSSGISRDSGIGNYPISDEGKSAWGKLTSQNRGNSATSYTSSVLSDVESDGEDFSVNPENRVYHRTKFGTAEVAEYDCDRDIGSGSTSTSGRPEVVNRKNDAIPARLHPASIRKISASGQRKKSKTKAGLTDIKTRPNHYNSPETKQPLLDKPRDKDMEDADILLENLDKTLYNKPHLSNISTASVV